MSLTLTPATKTALGSQVKVVSLPLLFSRVLVNGGIPAATVTALTLTPASTI